MNSPLRDIEGKIRAAGVILDPRAMSALYRPLQEKEPYRGIKVIRDAQYGPHQENLADIFVPDETFEQLRPVLIFVHGGGYTAGQRKLNAQSPFYDNVMVWAAKRGMVGVNITYRLAPHAIWPAAAEDIGSAVDWVGNNVDAYFGDPRRIFLMGHSAGASHVASFISREDFTTGTLPAIKGAILISATFGPTLDADISDNEAEFVAHERNYFSADPGRNAEQNAIAGLVRSPTPLMFVNAEYDAEFFHRHARALHVAFAHAQRKDRFIVLAGHNHMSEVFSINSGDVTLTREIEAFMRDTSCDPCTKFSTAMSKGWE
jgi:triacylglycerol lipase